MGMLTDLASQLSPQDWAALQGGTPYIDPLTGVEYAPNMVTSGGPEDYTQTMDGFTGYNLAAVGANQPTQENFYSPSGQYASQTMTGSGGWGSGMGKGILGVGLAALGAPLLFGDMTTGAAGLLGGGGAAAGGGAGAMDAAGAGFYPGAAESAGMVAPAGLGSMAGVAAPAALGGLGGAAGAAGAAGALGGLGGLGGLAPILSALGLGGAGGGLGSVLGPLLQGITSMQSGSTANDLASKLPGLMDPFAQYRAGFGQQLGGRSIDYQGKEPTLTPTPTDVTQIPGYQAGLQAVERAGASQGFTGSGQMMKSLQDYGGNFYNAERNYNLNQWGQQEQAFQADRNAYMTGTNQLAGLAGANVAPGAGALAAAELTSQGQASRAFGLGSLGQGLGNFLGGLPGLMSQLGQGGSGGYGAPGTMGNPQPIGAYDSSGFGSISNFGGAQPALA